MKAGLSIILLSLLSDLYCLAGETNTIRMAGRVIDYQARPVEGATVVCYMSSDGMNEDKYEPPGGALTTSDGQFSFQVGKDMAYSSALLVASKNGLALGWSQINHASELTTTIRLGKPSLFKGTVVDEAGHPFPDAKVRICLKNETMARYSEIAPLAPESWFTTRTNAQGQFTFDNIPGGSTADFGIEAPGRASVWTFYKFGLGEGEQFAAGCTDIRIVLPSEVSIKGQVVNELTGRAVTDANVVAIPYGRTGWRYYEDPIKTDPNGLFKFSKLAPDTYVLCATSYKAGGGNLIVKVEAGKKVHDVTIPLRGIPLEIITYDLEKEEPLENVRVRVTQIDDGSRNYIFNIEKITDTNGLARLCVPPGECEVKVFKEGHGGIFQPLRLLVEEGKPLRREVFVPRSACILSGELLDEKGQPLSYASAMLMSFGPRVLTDANGYFDTSHVHYYMSRLPTRIRVLARHISSGLGAVGTLEDPNRSGRPRGRIILKPAYTLTGRVTDPDGRNIPAAYVKLLQIRYRTLFTEVATNADGIYSIRSVPPPEGNDLQYAIAVCAEGFGLTQVSRIPFHDDTAKPVHVDPIVLLPADQAISGFVLDSNDQPVTGALVRIYGPRLSTTVSMPPCGKTLTNSQGRFRVEGMCKEPLRIRVTPPPPQKVTGIAWAYGGNENVKVVLGQKLIYSESLIGKSLSELKDLGIDLSPADVNDKLILVCFFDMNQRPSRNTVIQLARQAEHLKQKGIVIVAIQVSKITEDALNEWIKDKNVSFPVGIVGNDEEEIRSTWGVKSLPWLILTDQKHIVRAEGFSISELHEKMTN